MAETAAGSKSLKDGYSKTLLTLLALNAAGFYLAQHSVALTYAGLVALATGWMSLLPAGIGVALVGLLNALVSADLKARMVFWRWHFPYPGSQAFTRHGPNDHRVDMAALEKSFGPLPQQPREQNALWYRLYRTVASDPAVEQVHAQFLFARDYAFMSLLMLLVLGGGAGLAIRPAIVAIGYIGILILQWALATRAANVNGRRLVTTVLALKGAGS